MPALVTNEDAQHLFPWHLRRRSEGWKRRPLASPGPGWGSLRCLPGWPAPAPCAMPVPLSPFGFLHDCQVPRGVPGLFRHFTHLQHSLSPYLGGWYPAPLTERVSLAGIRPAGHHQAPALCQSLLLPFRCRNQLISVGTCCDGQEERSAIVVYHLTLCNCVTSWSLASTAELPRCGVACCMSACTIPQYPVGSSSPDSLCACRLWAIWLLLLSSAAFLASDRWKAWTRVLALISMDALESSG